MTPKLRPTSVYRPNRLRPVARQDREENDGRFRKKLGELVDEERGGDQPRRNANPQGAAPGRPVQEVPDDDQAEPSVGRNIDVRT